MIVEISWQVYDNRQQCFDLMETSYMYINIIIIIIIIITVRSTQKLVSYELVNPFFFYYYYLFGTEQMQF